MRLILDTNQVKHVVRTGASNNLNPTFVIPPLVWGEISRSGYPRERTAALSQFTLLFGADAGYFLQALAEMTEQEVRTAVPVYQPLSKTHQRFHKGFLDPSKEFQLLANKLKAHADQVAAEYRERGRRSAKQHNDMRSRGERLAFVKWNTIQDAEEVLFRMNEESWASETLAIVTATPNESGCGSKEALWNAMLDNPSLRLWMRVAITQSFGYVQCWTNDLLNNPAHGNDITDITLPLYARPGDVILTAEKKLKRSIEHSDPDGTVRVMTWDEYLQWRARGFE